VSANLDRAEAEARNVLLCFTVADVPMVTCDGYSHGGRDFWVRAEKAEKEEQGQLATPAKAGRGLAKAPQGTLCVLRIKFFIQLGSLEIEIPALPAGRHQTAQPPPITLFLPARRASFLLPGGEG
jgi:hypothetical protein